MSVTLERLFRKTAALYDMKLLAGKEGLENVVQWVHIVEDEEVTSFLHGHELVFTTGIRRENSKWILEFTHLLCKVGASGLILNCGPYIKEIPKEVIDYCNKEKFPLITVPWKTKLVDVTRIYCSQIMRSEQEEMSISSAFKGIIFNPDTIDYQKMVLSAKGFPMDSIYSMALIHVESDESKSFTNCYDIVKFHTEKIVKYNCDKAGVFKLNNVIVVIFSAVLMNKIEETIQGLLDVCQRSSSYKIRVAVGFLRKGVESISDNYQVTQKVLSLAIQQNKQVLYYSRLGIYKLLLNDEDEIGLMDFYKDSLGKLEEYDKSNGTDYVCFLKKYIESGYCIQYMADSECIHRNTVHYKLNKIKTILDCDLNDWQVRLEMYMSFCIKDII